MNESKAKDIIGVIYSMYSSSHRNKVYTKFPESLDQPNMQNYNPTYDSIVVKPDEDNITRGRISQIFAVDSRDRDRQTFPEPNHYRIQIPDEYKNVISVELIQGIIPRNPYNITTNCNVLYFEESYSECKSAIVTPGVYSIEELLAALENALNDVGESTYRVVLVPNQNIIRIESDLKGGQHLFRLLLSDPTDHNQAIARSIGPKLGFGLADLVETCGCIDLVKENIVIGKHTKFTKDFKLGDKIRFSSDTESIYQILVVQNDCTLILDRDVTNWECGEHLVLASRTGCNPFDLTGKKYVILEIPELHRMKSNNKFIQDSFAIIPFDPDCNGNTLINNATLPKQREIKYFNPPESRLSWLTISFRTHDGELYDFSGRENLLIFEIKAINQFSKYNLIGDN